ncbi:MAG: hypothetical protein Fur0010_18320 [Bdellovibrio sp.]
MKKLLLSIWVLFSISTALACDLPVAELNACAKLDWVEGPFVGQYSKAKLSFTTEQSTVESPDYLELEPQYVLRTYVWMIMMHHEHGGRPVVLTKLDKGQYLVDKVFFMGNMQGQWQLRFQILQNGQVLNETHIPVLDL